MKNSYRLSDCGSYAIVQLNDDHECFVDVDDLPAIAKYRWCRQKAGRNVYALANVREHGRKTTVQMHRLLLGRQTDLVVDHANRNGLDNRRHNLRFATYSNNAQNRRGKSVTSVWKGVTWSKQHSRWRALIHAHGTAHHLGLFDNEVDAAQAYNNAALKYFGEFACFNEAPQP